MPATTASDVLRTQVLVIGGGPVGLSTALHLDHQGVDTVLVEKHPATSTHPKASYFNVRTMEVLRQLGVADEVYATAMFPAGVSFYTSICGYKLGVFSGLDFPDHVERAMRATASPSCVTSQSVLEQILARRAAAAPRVRVLFGHEKTDLSQDDAGVRAAVVERASGRELVVEADYAIACEGVRSSTREALGRRLLGPPPFGHVINIYLEADIQSLVEERDQALFWIATPKATGAFIALGGDGKRFCFNTPYFPELGEKPEDFTEEVCLAKVRAALGTDRLPVRILAVGPWALCGQVIDRYRQRRVFFGGDTAHLNIPTGGFGFNTGMQETHNLAWKIAAVLRGDASDALLDTYHTERRPIAVFNVEKSRENAVNIRDTGATFGGHVPNNDEIDLDTERGRAQREEKSQAIRRQLTHFLFLGQEIGYGYWDSPIVVGDGSEHYAEEHGIDDPVYVYVPNAKPGARAPHLWVARGDDLSSRCSIHDLFATEFVLLTCGAGAEHWASELTGSQPGVRHYRVGPAGRDVDLVDLEGVFRQYYGLPEGGAVLVRPDGHVCWRAHGGPAAHRGVGVAEALAVALGRRLQGASSMNDPERSDALRPERGRLAPIKLAHVVRRTSRFQELVDWYSTVLAAKVVHGDAMLAFLTYDDEHHRIAIASIPGLEEQPAMAAGTDHVAFTLASLADLLQTYLRLKGEGIEPFWCINHGPTISMYYRDPDGNRVELQIDTMPTNESIDRWMRSGEFAANPIGVVFDPDEMVERFRSGEPLDSLFARGPLPEGVTPFEMLRF